MQVAEANETKGERYKDPKYFSKAIDCYKSAYDIDNDQDTLFNRARLHLVMTDLEIQAVDAFSHLQQSIECSRILCESNEAGPDAFHHLGQSYYCLYELVSDEDLASELDCQVNLRDLAESSIVAFEKAILLETDDQEKEYSRLSLVASKAALMSFLLVQEMHQMYADTVNILSAESDSLDTLICLLDLSISYFSAVMSLDSNVEWYEEMSKRIQMILERMLCLPSCAQIYCEVGDALSVISEYQPVETANPSHDNVNKAAEYYHKALALQKRKEIYHSLSDLFYNSFSSSKPEFQLCLDNTILALSYGTWRPIQRLRLLIQAFISATLLNHPTTLQLKNQIIELAKQYPNLNLDLFVSKNYPKYMQYFV